MTARRQPELGRLLSVGQVADRLGVTERTLRTWIAGGKIPVVRFSARCLRIRSQDVDAFVEAHRVDA